MARMHDIACLCWKCCQTPTKQLDKTEASVVTVRSEITMLEVTLPLSEVNNLQVALSVCCFVILYFYATGSNLLTVRAK